MGKDVMIKFNKLRAVDENHSRFFLLSGVHGHFEGDLPWADCDTPLKPAMAKLVGKFLCFIMFSSFYPVFY